ncbi:NAD(P)H-quinone oxidoreductase subunit 3 [Anaplasmataceae bacterium AB001_6]|nr:NAD(P)H-quinone oxidoreductase subunit 3 [Anaplasmataceae bacterium AB001_6]
MEKYELTSYLSIFLFLIITVIVSIVMFIIPTLFARRSYNKNKVSQYECGFDPFPESSKNFGIKFYLVSILFVIFDIEVAFLLPWALEFKNLGMLAMITMGSFLAILAVGLLYELKEGALEWN